MAIRYYWRMKTEAEVAYNFVTLLQRTNKRRYESTEYAYQAIREEIDIQGNKCEAWVLYYKRDSGLLDIYNSSEVDIKRHCRDIETRLREIDSMLGFPHKYDRQRFHNQLTTLERIFKNCIIIAESELEKLGVQARQNFKIFLGTLCIR